MFESDPAATLADFTVGDAAGAALAQMLAEVPHPSVNATRRSTEAYSWISKIDDWQNIYRSVGSSG